MNWRDQAACRDMDNRMFIVQSLYPDYTEAKKVCQSCPVSRACLDLALAIPVEDDMFGVFGGTSPHERKRMARRPRHCVNCGDVLADTVGGRIVCSAACKHARLRRLNGSFPARGTTRKHIALEDKS